MNGGISLIATFDGSDVEPEGVWPSRSPLPLLMVPEPDAVVPDAELRHASTCFVVFVFDNIVEASRAIAVGSVLGKYIFPSCFALRCF